MPDKKMVKIYSYDGTAIIKFNDEYFTGACEEHGVSFEIPFQDILEVLEIPHMVDKHGRITYLGGPA